MLAKFGFVLLVLAFGLMMFLAGALAPASVQSTINSTLTRFGIGAPPLAAAQPAAPQPTSTEAPASAAIPYDSLLVKAPVPPDATYGVQIGLFADASATGALAARLQALNYKPMPLAVVDSNGAPWSILVVGPYATTDEAETARAALGQALGTSHPLTLVVLPKPPKVG